jgi:molecular chaperone GrpE
LTDEAQHNPTPEEALTDAVAPEDFTPEPAVAGEDVESAEELEGPALEQQLAEAKDQHLRAVAELDNVRKRARRDVGVAEQRGVAKLARELLPALDNLDRALASAESREEDEEHSLTKGIRLVQQELLGALTRVGIEADSPKGEPFDPHKHEAVAQQPIEGTESGVVVEVYQPGYRYQDTVLRAAKVVVSA